MADAIFYENKREKLSLNKETQKIHKKSIQKIAKFCRRSLEGTVEKCMNEGRRNTFFYLSSFLELGKMHPLKTFKNNS